MQLFELNSKEKTKLSPSFRITLRLNCAQLMAGSSKRSLLVLLKKSLSEARSLKCPMRFAMKLTVLRMNRFKSRTRFLK